MAQIGRKIERRGGARPNSGPKPDLLSANQLKKMLRTEKKEARKRGQTMDERLMQVYWETGSDNLRVQIWKAWKQVTMIPVKEGGAADKALGPAVYLPEQRPQLETIIGGKKDES